MEPEVSLILLGAGSGRRFGSDKLTAPLDGIPVGMYALETFVLVPFARRIYVTRPDHETLWEKARALGYGIVMNRDPDRGISSSIRLGLHVLAAMGAADGGLLFAVSDQPRLRADSVRRMIDAFRETPDRIVRLAKDGREGNPVLFPASLCGELMRLEGDTGGKQVIERHRGLVRTVEAGSAEELCDVDVPEDLR